MGRTPSASWHGESPQQAPHLLNASSMVSSEVGDEGLRGSTLCPSRCEMSSLLISWMDLVSNIWGHSSSFAELSCIQRESNVTRKREISNFEMQPFTWLHSKLNFSDLLGKCVPLHASINRSFPCYMFLFLLQKELKKAK